jgi:hypothetical protein
MVNTGRFVILVLAYRFLVPLLSAEPDHATTREVVLLLNWIAALDCQLKLQPLAALDFA